MRRLCCLLPEALGKATALAKCALALADRESK